jgi:hypothetical protein
MKAVFHMTGRLHTNEINPEDLASTLSLVGFRECRWANFKGEKISRQRIDHFAKSATELVKEIRDPRLKNAFLEEIKSIRELFDRQGGVFPPRYILHAHKQDMNLL